MNWLKKIFPSGVDTQNSSMPPASGGWETVNTLIVTKKSLWVGDLFIADRDDGRMIEVPNGDYKIDTKRAQTKYGDQIIRIRISPSLKTGFKIGSHIGAISIDRATMGICDMNALDIAVGGRNDDFQDHIEELHLDDFGEIKFKLASDLEIIYLKTGKGDGTYPVFALTDADKTIGLEIEIT